MVVLRLDQNEMIQVCENGCCKRERGFKSHYRILRMLSTEDRWRIVIFWKINPLYLLAILLHKIANKEDPYESFRSCFKSSPSDIRFV